MKREGSPFRGTMAIALKEAADHLTSARMHLIMLLILLTAAGAVYAAIDQIKATVSQDPYLFLKLFTVARAPLPSFSGFMGFLLPLVAIALGFDGVNGEFGRRTMSRILAQPIYRDAVLFGKFLGGMLVIAIALVIRNVPVGVRLVPVERALILDDAVVPVVGRLSRGPGRRVRLAHSGADGRVAVLHDFRLDHVLRVCLNLVLCIRRVTRFERIDLDVAQVQLGEEAIHVEEPPEHVIRAAEVGES